MPINFIHLKSKLLAWEKFQTMKRFLLSTALLATLANTAQAGITITLNDNGEATASRPVPVPGKPGSDWISCSLRWVILLPRLRPLSPLRQRQRSLVNAALLRSSAGRWPMDSAGRTTPNPTVRP